MDMHLRDVEMLGDLFAEVVGDHLGLGMLAEAEAGDVTLTQISALRYVARHSPTYVGRLSAGLAISFPAATKAVDRLVAKKLLDRRGDPDDRRKEGLAVTEAGQALLDRVQKVRTRRLEGVLERMESAERRALTRALRGFLTSAFLTDNALVARTCERCGCDCFDACVVYQAHVALYGEAISP